MNTESGGMKWIWLILATTAAGGGIFIVHEVTAPVVYSVRDAQNRQAELNSMHLPHQCGQWTVHAHFNGEGRLQYAASGCTLEPEVKAYLQQHNLLMDEATTRDDIAQQEGALRWVWEEDGSAARAHDATKGMDEAIRQMWKGLEK